MKEWDEAARWLKARRMPAHIKARLRALRPWMFSEFGPHSSLSYHSCRYCKRGVSEKLQGLWKYGVRHYICEDCKKAALEG